MKRGRHREERKGRKGKGRGGEARCDVRGRFRIRGGSVVGRNRRGLRWRDGRGCWWAARGARDDGWPLWVVVAMVA